MQGEHSTQSSFFALIYERLVPTDHLLRKITAAVDFGFVTDLVRDCYCPDKGRPSWDPLVLFKAVFLQFLYDLSDRQGEEQVNLHLACKWFVGLQPDETGPDHTALTRFRARLGPEKFQAIFNEIVHQARQAGLVHDRLRIIDATHLAAKVDLFRLPPPPPGASRAEGVTADQGYNTDENHQHLQAQSHRSGIMFKHRPTNPQVLGPANPDSQRERPQVERKFAEQKRYHGLRQARYWGLAKVPMQVLPTCLVVNCKRLAKLLQASCSPPRAGLCPANATGR